MIKRCLDFFKATLFVAHLSKLLINYPKLEIVADDVFIKGNNKSRSLKIRRKKKRKTFICTVCLQLILVFSDLNQSVSVPAEY